jgi:CRISPR-associated endonuclease Cas2
MAKKKEIGFVEKMKKFSRAGMPHPHSPNRNVGNLDELPTLEERIERIFKIIKQNNRPANHMIFFVMYDIERTKVRNQIVKYLLREGCTRVQKSIFLADLPLDTYNRMRSELAQVQECYENQDSILIVPISTDYLQSMKVIGQTLDVDLILKNRNTLFF